MQKLNDLLKSVLPVTSLKELLTTQLKATWSRLVREGKKDLYVSVNKELKDLLLDKENRKQKKTDE